MLPRLTPAERLQRQEEKRQLLLGFLASGETWTDLATAAYLWHLSPDAAATTLRGMIRDHLTVREDISTGPRAVIPIYGITPNGIAYCHEAPVAAQEYQQGRLLATNIPHQLALQRVRITAERAGWSHWQPGRLLYGRGLPVVPDAIAIDPHGCCVAVEVERNVKSYKRRREVLSGHVLVIARKTNWQRVVYVCDARCDASRLQALYMSLDELETPGGRAPMTDMHRGRFSFINLADFNG